MPIFSLLLQRTVFPEVLTLPFLLRSWHLNWDGDTANSAAQTVLCFWKPAAEQRRERSCLQPDGSISPPRPAVSGHGGLLRAGEAWREPRLPWPFCKPGLLAGVTPTEAEPAARPPLGLPARARGPGCCGGAQLAQHPSWCLPDPGFPDLTQASPIGSAKRPEPRME